VSHLRGLRWDSKGGAIFRQQAESRAGVAEIADPPDGGEQLSVTESLPLRSKIKDLTCVRFFCLKITNE
ncbi:MAG: hypothetical protein Q8L68_01330, partial [Methylococcales bacterium]|nr:hypothetical protein [Methylococcales bacterium]